MVELADIATNEKHRLNGFRVLGIFPFYLKYIRTDTHIKLCGIKAEIQNITKDPKLSDFQNPEIQRKALPLINKYCVTGLINNRFLGWILKYFVARKVKSCSHKHIHNLYVMIHKLDDPTFFLPYWSDLNLVDHTLLSEVKRLSEKSSPIKKKQE